MYLIAWITLLVSVYGEVGVGRPTPPPLLKEVSVQITVHYTYFLLQTQTRLFLKSFHHRLREDSPSRTLDCSTILLF